MFKKIIANLCNNFIKNLIALIFQMPVTLSLILFNYYILSSLWSARQIYYNGSGSTFINSIASSPGSPLNLTTAVLKTLGAQIRSGTIALYILARSNENKNYFYPANIIVRAEWRNKFNIIISFLLLFTQ